MLTRIRRWLPYLQVGLLAIGVVGFAHMASPMPHHFFASAGPPID